MKLELKREQLEQPCVEQNAGLAAGKRRAVQASIPAIRRGTPDIPLPAPTWEVQDWTHSGNPARF